MMASIFKASRIQACSTLRFTPPPPLQSGKGRLLESSACIMRWTRTQVGKLPVLQAAYIKGTQRIVSIDYFSVGLCFPVS